MKSFLRATSLCIVLAVVLIIGAAFFAEDVSASNATIITINRNVSGDSVTFFGDVTGGIGICSTGSGSLESSEPICNCCNPPEPDTGQGEITCDITDVDWEIRNTDTNTVTHSGSIPAGGTYFPGGCTTSCTENNNACQEKVSYSRTRNGLPNGNYRATVTSVDCTGNPESNSVDFTINVTKKLTVQKQGTGSCTVTSNPSGINCGNDCFESYEINENVTLNVSPASNSELTGWGGGGNCGIAGNPTSPTVTMSDDRTCKPICDLKVQCSDGVDNDGDGLVDSNDPGCSGPGDDDETSYRLSVNVNGLGAVDSSPAGISSCTSSGGDCTENYAPGTGVTLTPTPNTSQGYIFDGWSGNADCFDGSVSMNSNKSCTANFVDTHTLTLDKTGTGSGSVSTTDGNISCGTSCSSDSHTYTEGDAVTLSATADADSVFAGWSGGGGDCGDGSVTMNAAKTCTATFDTAPPNTYSLGVSLSGSGSGTVTDGAGKINCPGDCTGTYDDGTNVTLTAAADGSSVFNSWSGDCSGTNTQDTVSMTTNRSCTATFDPAPAGEGTITVSSNEATTWELTGPEPQSQTTLSTGVTYNNQDTGTYTLGTLADLAGFKTPTISPSDSQSLSDGGTISFDVNYPPTQCNDGIDNDGDGFIDHSSVSGNPDPDCDSIDDDDESGTAGTPECRDTVDNDGDGFCDWSGTGVACTDGSTLGDPGCVDGDDDDERNTLPQCDDDADNDGDGLTDFDGGDPGCESADDDDETDAECSDEIDNDGDGLIDFPDDPQCDSSNDESEDVDLQFEEF